MENEIVDVYKRDDFGNVLYLPASSVEKIMKDMERGLEKGYVWLGWNPENTLLGLEPVYILENKQVAEDFCWDPEQRYMPNQAIRLLPAYIALNETLQNIRAEGKSPTLIPVDVKGLERIDPSKGSKQAGYEALGKILKEMGAWDSYVSRELVTGIQEGQECFSIPLAVKVGERPLQVMILVAQDKGVYAVEGVGVRPLAYSNSKLEEIQGDIEAYDWTESTYRNYVLHQRATSLEEWDAWQKVKNETQFFPFKQDFRLTVEQACNLFDRRDVYMRIPNAADKKFAWFTFAPNLKDPRGNGMLLQYSDQHNFSISGILDLLPLKENLEPGTKKELQYALQAGNTVSATRLGVPDRRVMLVAAPAEKGLLLLTGDPDNIEQQFVSHGPPKGPAEFFCAYDSGLNRYKFASQMIQGEDNKLELVQPYQNPPAPSFSQSRKR